MKVKERTSSFANPRNIPVVILCGGRGTRLKEETGLVPKPMVHIGGKPILWHIMKIYYEQGFRKFILPLGYKGEKIRDYIHNYTRYATDFTLTHGLRTPSVRYHKKPVETWEITCVDTGLDTQTGGRIKKLRNHLRKSPLFMLTYGDGVSDVNLKLLLKEHIEKRRVVTMTAVRPPIRFGEVVLKDGDVVSFAEKPVYTTHHSTGLINGGFFAVNSDVFDFMSDEDSLNFEKETLPRLAEKGQLAAVPHHGYWQCMDTIRDTELLNEAWEQGDAPWKIWKTA
jgi:glucose-1-phosphate cytidylyltransferase